MENKIAYQIVDNIKVSNIEPIKLKTRAVRFKVAKFDKDGKFIVAYESIKDAAIAIGEEKKTNKIQSIYSGIIKVCTKNSTVKTAYSYQWRYVHDNGEIIKRKCDE